MSTVTQNILIDSNKRALIQLIGILSDDTDHANTTDLVVVDASSLNFALNANGQIMQSNVHPRAAYPLSLKAVYGDVHIQDGFIKLFWDDDANSEIITFGTGAVSFDLEELGWSTSLQSLQANNTGDIKISTVGAPPNVANDAFTLFLDLRKDPQAFDQGQTADPHAFNTAGIA